MGVDFHLMSVANNVARRSYGDRFKDEDKKLVRKSGRMDMSLT
jgi:hypothetical protein